MMPRSRLSLALGFLVAQGAAHRAGAQSAPDFAAIDRHAERVVRESRVPGAAIAIVRGDSIVHARGFGHDARGRPVTPATSFVLGSMSKSITALAIMRLVERGKVDLDRPARDYLTDFRIASADSGASITVRQLLLHTSGIPHGAPRGSGAQPSLRDHVAALRAVDPESPPGSMHSYASPNYLVLGAIVETVSGVPFAVFVEREIFAPLLMRNSFTSRARAERASFSGGHVYALGFPVRSTLAEEADRLPTAGLMSSAEDLAHLMIMALGGGAYRGNRVLGEELMRTMLTGAAPSDGFSYAFGWRDGQVGGTRAVHHGGIVPDFAGRMIMLPDSGWGVVVLVNASSAIPWPVGPASHRLANDIAAALAGRALPTRTSRHRLFFAIVGALMTLLVLAQLRTLYRAWRAAPSGRHGEDTRGAWRASATDLLFLAFVAVLPRFVGLSWPDLLRGAPDVAVWLLLLAALGLATIGARLRQAVRARA